jgi:sodium/potassium-transporting ATPase subunit alpha
MKWRKSRRRLLLTFAKEFAHFFAIILWIAAALAFFAEWRDPGQGIATLGFAIVGVILINGVFSVWQAYRAEQSLAVLKKLLPNATKVMRSGAVRQVPAAQFVPGDVILLEAGDILLADCRLVEAFSVRVMPLTIIEILAVDLGANALGLGAEQPAPDIMKAPPR